MTIRRSRWFPVGLALLSVLATSCALASAQRGAGAADGAAGTAAQPGEPAGAAPASGGSASGTSQAVSEALKLLQQLTQAYSARHAKGDRAPAPQAPAPAQPGSPSAPAPATPPPGVANGTPAPGGAPAGCPDASGPSPKLVRRDVELARAPIAVATLPRPALPPAVAAVRGTVRAESGTPIADAVVLVAGERAVTDAKGGFVIARSPTGRQGLLASARGFADRCLTIDVPAKGELAVTLSPVPRAYPRGVPPKAVSRAVP